MDLEGVRGGSEYDLHVLYEILKELIKLGEKKSSHFSGTHG